MAKKKLQPMRVAPLLFEILKQYAQDDPEMMGDAVQVDLIHHGKVLLSGDWLHDKIDDKIEGFLHAVEWLGHKIQLERTTKISEDCCSRYKPAETMVGKVCLYSVRGREMKIQCLVIKW